MLRRNSLTLVSIHEPYRIVTLMMIVSYFTSTIATCPSECFCNLDDTGRIQVVCTAGGMRSPIPVSQMSLNTEVIIITAPEYNENDLTIGPIFQQFKKLEELHITHSNIPAIGKHSFWGVPSIKVLNLTHNNISNIYDHNFIGMVNLVELQLADNRIDSLPSATFQHLSELRILSLARNRISNLVPRLFLKLGKLRELDLSGNPLQELVPEVFKDVQELRTFRCRACALTSINTQIYHLLPYLALLDLGDNDFKYITHDEFIELRRLRHLWLDGNKLPVVLENTFINQNELTTLSLARNRLAKITNTAFNNLTNLTHLDISYNKLHRLDTVSFIPVADSLLMLNMSGNNLGLADIVSVLQVVTKVREIGLADLNLSDLPQGIFDYQKDLRKLNLSRNAFVQFPVQVLSTTPKLQEIDLSSNRFRGLDEKVVIRLEQISTVHLSNNSWTCDLCHIKGMILTTTAEWRPSLHHPPTASQLSGIRGMEPHMMQGSGILLHSLYCIAPPNLIGRTIGSLSHDELNWCSIYDTKGTDYDMVSNSFLSEEGKLGIIAAGCTSMLLIVTGIILTIAMCYSKRHGANYYTNEEKRGPENEKIFENPTAILGENGEISFKFPLDISQTKKKVSISTIDEIKKDSSHQHHAITSNGS